MSTSTPAITTTTTTTTSPPTTTTTMPPTTQNSVNTAEPDIVENAENPLPKTSASTTSTTSTTTTTTRPQNVAARGSSFLGSGSLKVRPVLGLVLALVMAVVIFL
ncbi:hypothetical protein V1264_009624 [Littorina saxatilis]|uniref:Uncharacterized protein n=3 Tax=Littorina saxatilis TaxID=31220 RepID=A0AAN9G1L3_9CAEN